MPVYALACECGWNADELLGVNAPLPACPLCGGSTRRVPSLPQKVGLAPWMRTENEQGRELQRRFIESPEVKAKLASGEYEIRKNQRSCKASL